MNFSENIQRIKQMEIYYDTVFNTIHNAPELLKDEHISAMLEKLTNYYDNGQWMQDYQADERGEIPKDLKRGMLTEDAIYNLLYDVKEAKRKTIQPLEDIPLITYNRYIEIGEIKAEDGDFIDTKKIEIVVGSSIFDENIKRVSVDYVLKRISELCRNKKAELVFKPKEGGKWDPLDWASSVYLIVCKCMESNRLDSFAIWTDKGAFELFAPEDSKFRSENDKRMYRFLVDKADEIVRLYL